MLRRLKSIGPGAMVAAAFIGPGTVTTATIAGASYGYTLLWAILFSIIATAVLQEMSARLGVIAHIGVGEAIRSKITNRVARIAAFILIISAIFIGNAAYEAGNMTGAVIGFSQQFNSAQINPLLIIIAVAAFILLYSGKFKIIERALIFLVSVMGIVFILSAILLQPNWGEVLTGCFNPTLPKGGLIMVVGLIGTTVVPYNLFLHASSVKQKWRGSEDLNTARWDTIISVTIGGLITMAILITAATVFQGQEKEVVHAADLSEQLKPLLGDWSVLFISIGFLAAGLSSSITAPLAAAFATSELMGWKDNLKGRNFRLIWISILLIGVIFSSLGIKPLLIILFAQVANGILLPVIALFLLWVMNDFRIMGKYANGWFVNILGAIIILVTIGLGLKGIMSATGLL